MEVVEDSEVVTVGVAEEAVGAAVVLSVEVIVEAAEGLAVDEV